jgi:CheY-like chemotaxis protein
MPLETKTSAAHRSSAETPYDRPSIRTLVVDDDPVTLKIVATMLKSLGYCVDSADDGHAAIRHVKAGLYDLVITDLQMPGISGHTLARRVKKQSRQTAVIIMTGCSRSEVREYMADGPADRWIFKPFGLIELSGLLGELGLSRTA